MHCMIAPIEPRLYIVEIFSSSLFFANFTPFFAPLILVLRTFLKAQLILSLSQLNRKHSSFSFVLKVSQSDRLISVLEYRFFFLPRTSQICNNLSICSFSRSFRNKRFLLNKQTNTKFSLQRLVRSNSEHRSVTLCVI